MLINTLDFEHIYKKKIMDIDFIESVKYNRVKLIAKKNKGSLKSKSQFH